MRGTAAADDAPPPFALGIAHKYGLRVLIVGAGLAVLLALSAPTPLQVIAIAVGSASTPWRAPSRAVPAGSGG